MKRWITIGLLALVLTFTLGMAAQPKPVYEYKFVFEATEKKTNELAAQNWELIAIGGGTSGPAGNVLTYVFRREKK